MAELQAIMAYCEQQLMLTDSGDYCPNGLQVEACHEIKKIVTGVTASLELIERAAAIGANLLLVHHGYFWNHESQPLTGMKGRRIAALYAANLSMAAYHLPLDRHPRLGNNVQLGQKLGISEAAPVAEEGLLWAGKLTPARDIDAFGRQITELTGREPLLIAGGEARIERIAWCTGGAQSYLDQAADLGFDAFLTGEASEYCYHIARERNIHFIAAGHHATERYGVVALGEALAQAFDVEHINVDLFNPI